MAPLTADVLIVALVSGILPAVLWLFFWLREDKYQPEPTGLLILTFFAGALGVLLVLPLEQFIEGFGVVGTELIFIYAAAEELVKFGIVYLIDFNSSYLDEPVDYAVYLITGALGFATMENVLFLTAPALRDNIPFIVETGILRFLGATVLHSMLAATLGIIIGFVFYEKTRTRRLFMLIGLLIVTILHTIFNYFIIKYVEINGLLTLGILWIVTVIIIWLLEKVRDTQH